MEQEVVVHDGANRGQRGDGSQCHGNRARISDRSAGYDKPHDLVGVQVVVVLADILSISQEDVLPGKRSKVEDDFVAFRHRDVKLRSGGR